MMKSKFERKSSKEVLLKAWKGFYIQFKFFFSFLSRKKKRIHYLSCDDTQFLAKHNAGMS